MNELQNEKTKFTKQWDYENGNITFDEFVEMNYKFENYYKYAVQFDNANNTQHAQTIENNVRKQMSKIFNVTTQITETNGKRNVYGNYNDNNVMMKKCFNHLNSLKRSYALKNQSYDENTRMMHENTVLNEILNLELSLRTLQKNIREND